MGKQQYRNTNYTPISKNESYLLDLIRSEDLLTFGVDEIKALSDWKKTRIHNVFSSLEKKGHIIRIKRDRYTLEDRFYDRTLEVVTDAVKPSYISFWTGLSYHGFTDQQVKMIQLVSTKQYDDLDIEGRKVEISTFKPKRFFGYTEREGIIIAEKEKLFVDSLFMLDKCGGLDEYIKCLKNAVDVLDKNRLIKYLVDFDNKSLISRMGFLLDFFDLVDDQILNRLKKNSSTTYILLDPNGGPVITHNSGWKIKINKKLV